jgi:hypothetical protein
MHGEAWEKEKLMTTRNSNRGACAARTDLFLATSLPFRTSPSLQHRFCRALQFNERCALVVLFGILLALKGPSILFAEVPGIPPGVTLPDVPIPLVPARTTPQANSSQPPGDEAKKKELERKAAEGELHEEEHQHFLGFIPYFNTVNGDAAPPLNPSQKFTLAFKRSITPLTFVGTGLLAGIGQAENDFQKYGQGAQGYGKRFGAQYADTFDGNMIASAIFPVLLRQDPRYYRLGTGGFQKRFWYSLSAAVRAKGDDGKWQPAFSKILGSFAAGGISNLYYPSPNRGAGLTVERGSLVIAERAASEMLDEFMPDIQQILFHSKNLPQRATYNPAATTGR